MNRLYPLKFIPQYKDKIWGGKKLREILGKKNATDKAGESWEISSVQGNISVVENGFLAGNNLQELIEVYMGDLVGDKIYDQFGIEFPLLIKFIDATEQLSIQVHPNDEMALKRHSSYGKTEMWYIIQAEKNSELIVGFNSEIEKNTYVHHLENNTLTEILNYVKVKAGDVVFLPAGRIHAIGAGILLAEIQQTSDITYRIYDFNRLDSDGNPRELHTDLSIDAIDYSFNDKYKINYLNRINESSELVKCKYFTTNILDFNITIEKDYLQLDSFIIYMCLDGKFVIEYYNNETINVSKGESLLIPAEIKNLRLNPSTATKILEIYIDLNQTRESLF
jgi:mannose-6-phosphate isomerase